MRVTRLNSQKTVLLKINKYKIDWENDGNSSLETRFRDLIYPFWKNHIVLFQLIIPSSLLKIDFLNCNKKLAVEINGPQHNSFNKFFHNNSRANYLSSIKRDLIKIKWLEDNNIQLLELQEEDLDNFSPKMIQEKYGINII
ncbi:MAG: hypothetical protein Q7R95_06025 [bacterium]|nr:hypothetical protein [bacterium]